MTDRRGPGVHEQMQAARKRVAKNSREDWDWLAESLSDPEKKWFVAEVFKFQPVPKRLLYPMLGARVLAQDPSLNRVFLDPCIRSYGARRVLEELLRYLESGTDVEKAGAASAFYWTGAHPRNEDEDVDELRERFRCQMLREFISNSDLQVRRCIIPQLRLEPGEYPEESRSLVPEAITIARSHADEYIRHRVEIQLGAGGPFMAIPDAHAPSAEEGDPPKHLP